MILGIGSTNMHKNDSYLNRANQDSQKPIVDGNTLGCIYKEGAYIQGDGNPDDIWVMF